MTDERCDKIINSKPTILVRRPIMWKMMDLTLIVLQTGWWMENTS